MKQPTKRHPAMQPTEILPSAAPMGDCGHDCSAYATGPDGFAMAPRMIPTVPAAPSACPVKSPNQGHGRCSDREAGSTACREQDGQTRRAKNRRPRANSGSMTNTSSLLRVRADVAKPAGTDTVCIADPTQSSGDVTTSNGRQVRLGVPIAQLLAIYDLLKPFVSDKPVAAAEPSPSRGGGPDGSGGADCTEPQPDQHTQSH
jgi:hypothetical protein